MAETPKIDPVGAEDEGSGLGAVGVVGDVAVGVGAVGVGAVGRKIDSHSSAKSSRSTPK